MRRVLAIAVVFAAVAAGLLLTGASEEGGSARTYKLQFDNSFGLTEGGDLKVGGVRVGQTKSFEVDESGPRPLALVEAEITESGFGDLRRDATCKIKPQSLIGEYFVDCQPGSSDEKLGDGATIPVKQTASVVPTDLVNNIMRRPYRERFRLILAELGTGLAGRPEELNEAVRRAHPGLRETSRVLRLLGRQNRIIQDFITNSDTVVAELEARKTDVSRWVAEAGETAEISGSRRDALRAQFRKLPRFLDEFRPTLTRLGELSDEQVPALADLRRAAPDLTKFLTELGPFSKASRPSIRSLGRASTAGTAALNESQDEIDRLLEASKDAPGLAKPLRQLLQSLDDRARSIEPDPRSKDTAPPAPDKTADSEGRGFTGFENLLNYVYWQVLAVNAFDEFSHVLRTGIFEAECGSYHADPSPEVQKECGSYTGPYQPGLQGNAPDYTARRTPAERGSAQRIAREDGEPPPSDSGPDDTRRGAGEPEVGPRPGERDPSQPQIVLPPELQRLVDELGKNLPAVPDVQNQLPNTGNLNDDQLLDFLLAP